MQNIIIGTLLGLMIGYGVYPLLHPTINSTDKNINQTLTKTSERDSYEPNIQKKIDNSVALSSQNRTIEKQTYTTSLADQPITTIETQTEITSNDALESIQTQDIVTESDQDYVSADQIELNEWTDSHKKELFKILDEKIPSDFLEGLKTAILKDNDFINSPTVRQDPAIDSDWGIMMEYQLRDVIERHPSIAGFEIFSISCKQLTCEILGVENEPYSWMPIMNSFFKDPTISKTLDPPSIKGTSYPRDKLNYWYIRLGFKA